MSWDVEVTDECKAWLDGLSEEDFDSVDYAVDLLTERGPGLDHPHSSKVTGSRHAHMRELRVQSGGRPLRVFYAFDPRRTADDYLDELRSEGLIP